MSTLKQLRDDISNGKIKSTAAVSAVFDRIETIEPKVGAYLSLYKEQAMKQAEAVDAKIEAGESIGVLAGVPVAIKDNMCTAFGATTCASKILENFHAPYNAHVVEKLQAADAVIVGKCNLDEFAMGSSTENSGLKQTLNPWNTDYVPGGSSGGSAAAVAAGAPEGGPGAPSPLLGDGGTQTPPSRYYLPLSSTLKEMGETCIANSRRSFTKFAPPA